jgi:hypothetical protein
MSCPICGHTMQQLATAHFWCPRCGTLKSATPLREDFQTPKLVVRCRLFKEQYTTQTGGTLWHHLGIEESIYPMPGNPVSEALP